MSETNYAMNSGLAASKRRRWPLILILVFAVLAGLLAWFLPVNRQYNIAVAQMEKGYYEPAMKHISGLPSWFRNAGGLMAYTQACAALAEGDYVNAHHYFSLAGGYRDAKDRVHEAGYLLGCKYAEEGNIEEAKSLFRAVLIEERYRASDALRHTAYLAAVRMYDLAEYGSTYNFFSRNRLYLDCEKFLTLHEAINYSTLGASMSARELYGQLAELDGFHNALDIMSNDQFMPYYLEGRWRSDRGNYYLQYKSEIDGRSQWTLDTSLPIPDPTLQLKKMYLLIEDRVMYMSLLGRDKQAPAFRFELVSVNEMKVLCTKNNATYTMTREQ